MKRYTRSFGDRMAAEALLAEEKRLIDRGEWMSPAARTEQERRGQNPLTLREWAAESLARPMRDSTRVGYQRVLEKHVFPVFGDSPLLEITPMDVTQWYARLSARLRERQKQKALLTDGRAILWHAYRTFAMVMRDAAEHDLIERAPTRVRGAMRYVTKYEAPVLTVDQMRKPTTQMPEYMRVKRSPERLTGPNLSVVAHSLSATIHREAPQWLTHQRTARPPEHG